MKLFVLLFAVAGCALLGKSEPQIPRYFTPEYDGDAPAAAARSDLQLRLGRVEGWSHLRERMAARPSERELVYSDDRRWTERPEIYLRRALSRALFEERGLTESLSGRALTLDVELIAFEELRTPPRARLQARFVVRDERTALMEQTVTVDRPMAAGAEADAFSQALHAGVTQIADRVVTKLTQQAAQAAK